MKVQFTPSKGAGQPHEAASAPTPPTEKVDTMAAVVNRLAQLRETYLADLKAARDKVKRNFLR